MNFPLASSSPSALGLAPEPLDRLAKMIEGHIAQGRYPGAQIAIAQGATRLTCDRKPYTVAIGDDERIAARAVVIATGAEYRRLPIDNLANKTGWVAWAGSSFSAPIVSALSAKIWYTLPAGQQNPTGVMNRVRADLTTGNAPELDVPAIRTSQS